MTRTFRRTWFDPEAVFADAVGSFHRKDQMWAWGCCPFHSDSNPSFCMNVETGWYRCAATHCGATGNSIVGFVSALHGIDNRSAIEFLEAHYG